MDYSSEVLLWLTSGMDGGVRHTHFPAAYAQGCCHLCHLHISAIHDDCPCLHWLLNSYANVNRLQPVFDRYGLRDAVQYLALCAAAQRAQGKRRVLCGCFKEEGEEQNIGMQFVIAPRRYQFTLAHRESQTCRFEFGNLRTGMWDAMCFTLLEHDRVFAQRLREWDDSFPFPPAFANAVPAKAAKSGRRALACDIDSIN